MTLAADASLVISTVAEWSGEISLLHGQESITAGDLSAQSIIEAVFIYPPYRHVPPLEMTLAADASLVISRGQAAYHDRTVIKKLRRNDIPFFSASSSYERPASGRP